MADSIAPREGLRFWSRGWYFLVDLVRDDWVYVRRWRCDDGVYPPPESDPALLRVRTSRFPKRKMREHHA